MALIWCGILNLCIGLVHSQTQSWQFHQTDYEVKLDRMEVPYQNHKYFKNANAQFVWYNRTQRTINGSGIFLLNLTKEIRIDVQVYKFLSNEYRFFPITISGPMCASLKENIFGTKNLVDKYTNFKQCPPINAGFYYIKYAVIDFSKYPPYIPAGDYKVQAKLYYNSEYIMEIDFYGSVIPFITKWEN